MEEEDHVPADSSSSDEDVHIKDKSTDIMKSKDGNIVWQKKTYPSASRFQCSNILNLAPSPIRFLVTRIEDKYGDFEMLFPLKCII